MSIDIALLSKIIGGLLAASTASYGGWVAYDVNNPTFHRLITEQGWVWSPIDGDMGTNQAFDEERSQALSKVAGDWRCSLKLFKGFNAPNTNTFGKDKGDSNNPKGHKIPDKPSVTTTPETDKSVGCLVADLGHAPNNKRSGFIKWELALRSGNRGFIYTGLLSLNTIKEQEQNSQKREIAVSLSYVFEVTKSEQETWKVGKGFTWADTLVNNLNGTGGNTDYVRVVLPNNSYEWEPNSEECKEDKCFSSNDWVYQKWVGFWEQKDGGDKQPTDALFIGKASQSFQKDWANKKYQHDIWQTPNFDFSNSNQIDTEITSAAWDSSIDAWYDGDETKWKDTPASSSAKDYLVEIYKPWAKKKGTWTKAEGVCYQSNSRHIGEEESQRLLNFCYQKQGSEQTA